MATFVALGMFWGSWAVVIADVQRTFSLSYGALGILLAVAIGLAGGASVVAGVVTERWGSARVLVLALGIWAVCMTAAALAPSFAAFAAAFLLTEIAGGCVDMAMNAAATLRLAGQPGALVRFHALFNGGALCGAACAGLVLYAGASWRVLWPGLAVGVVALAAWTALARERRPLDHPAAASLTIVPGPQGDVVPAAGPAGAGGTAGAAGSMGLLRRLRADGLLVFLVVFAVAELTEGGVDTWGVLYLRNVLAAGVLLGAGAYVVGQSVAALTRAAGGPSLGRLSARVALIVGGLVAGAGILTESLSHVAAVAGLGLALGAGGASLFWPLVMSEAAGRASQPSATIGAFTAAGYVGWVAGAPLVGWVADNFGLARGLQVLAAMAFLVAAAAIVGHRRRQPIAAAADG
jgi:MFS family permease